MARDMFSTKRRIIHAVEIDRDPAACWQTFGRISDWPRWFPMLTSVDRARGDVDFTPGEELALHLQFAGRGARIPVRIEEVGPARVRWVGRGFGVTGEHAFYVEPLAGDRTRFVSDEVFSGLPLRLLPGAVFASLERETQDGLARFRELCVARP